MYVIYTRPVSGEKSEDGSDLQALPPHSCPHNINIVYLCKEESLGIRLTNSSRQEVYACISLADSLSQLFRVTSATLELRRLDIRKILTSAPSCLASAAIQSLVSTPPPSSRLASSHQGQSVLLTHRVVLYSILTPEAEWMWGIIPQLLQCVVPLESN